MNSQPRSAAPLASTAATPSWAEAEFQQFVRLGDWSAAATAFDAAYPHPVEPELRFVRARIAAELGDSLRVVDLLNGLAPRVPALQSEIEGLLATAWSESGEPQRAAALLESKPGIAARRAEAKARLQTGDLEAAKRLYTALTQDKQNGTGYRAEAWSALARIAQQTADAASRDRALLKLALDFPTTEAAADLEQQAKALGSKLVLDKKQRLVRAQAYAAEGRVSHCETELRHLETAPGAPVGRAAQLRALAQAHYKSRADYVTAARLYEQAARLDAGLADHDLFYAARAWSRANHDDVALKGYERVAAQFPKSRYGRDARYHAARLHYIAGRFAAAVRGFDVYLARRGGADEAAARYERAVALVAAGMGERAVQEVSALLKASNTERETALFHHLLGLAHLARKAPELAAAEFRAAVDAQPLSFAALMSSARLEALGVPAPPPLLEPEALPLEPPLALRLPEKVALLAALGLEQDAERELGGQADAFSASYAPRGGEALCLAFGKLDAAKERYRHAQKVVRERVVFREVSPATRWLWDCLYPTPYSSLVAPLEAELNLPAGLLHGVMRQESAFGADVSSHAGAVGLMQLMRPTAERLAKSLSLDYQPAWLRRPGYNLKLGAHYLERMLRRFDGSVPLAAAAYNAGPGAVTRWLDRVGQLPLDLFVAHIIYGETRSYVQRVVGNWARYRYLALGEQGIPRLALTLPTVKSATADDY